MLYNKLSSLILLFQIVRIFSSMFFSKLSHRWASCILKAHFILLHRLLFTWYYYVFILSWSFQRIRKSADAKVARKPTCWKQSRQRNLCSTLRVITSSNTLTNIMPSIARMSLLVTSSVASNTGKLSPTTTDCLWRRSVYHYVQFTHDAVGIFLSFFLLLLCLFLVDWFIYIHRKVKQNLYFLLCKTHFYL